MINTRYEIIKKLGEGRSSVYLCRDIEFPAKEYAIKILPVGISQEERNSFIKEYFVLKKLEHPLIIRPFGLGTVVHKDNEEDIEIGSLFITLEYFNGDELLSSKEIYKETILREIIKQICSVLYYLHQSKYIYYDLKPENILLSLNGENPEIRFIDLGLAEYSPSTTDYEVKGTANYIAPELLKKESHNHSVDFYSLGIILYRILYNRFPFEFKNELEIFKAAIESEIDFPPLENYSPEIIEIVKKLTEKDAAKRYSSALAIIKDFGFSIDNSLTKEFLPAKVFSSRSYAVNILSKYISDRTSSEVFAVKGFDGVGKSSLLNKMMESYSSAILISEVRLKSGADLIRYILRKIIFSEAVFPGLTIGDKNYFIELLSGSDEKILGELRSAVVRLSAQCKFILLIDDFNLFDQLAVNLLLEVIPFFQINNIKIIISESSEHDFISSKLNNVREVVLGSFTDEEMMTFIQESYNTDFPQSELQKLILTYADLIPGNIKSFIKDLILLGIMKFSESGVSFSDEADKLSALKTAHFAIYNLRLENLSDIELNSVKIISAIDTYIDVHTLSVLLDLSEGEVRDIVSNLQSYNILQENTSGQTLVFTSEAFKKHVYASIENKNELHAKIASKLSEKVPQFNRLELARQYELTGDYENCFYMMMKEAEHSEKHFAYEYIRKILVHLAELPLKTDKLNLVKVKLSEIYFKLGDVKSVLTTIQELKNTLPENEFSRNLRLIEGNSLIDSGEVEAGKKVISDLLSSTEDTAEKQKLKVELAYADYELKKYEDAIKQCNELLSEDSLSAELKGRCYNLLGIIDSHWKNDPSSAITNFELAKTEYNKEQLLERVARAENNIGYMFVLLSNYENAEKHWEIASTINSSIGNLEQEGTLLNNLGDFYFARTKYDFAIDSYKRAQNIFLSLGNKASYGIIVKNLCETYLKSCEYQEAINSIKEANKIFYSLNDAEKICDILTIKGLLFFNIGSLKELNETIQLLETQINKNGLSLRYFTRLKHLKILRFVLMNHEISIEDIMKLLNEYETYDDRNFVIECYFLLIRQLIREKNFDVALKILIDKEFIDLISQNSILAAEREYFFGIISKNINSDKIGTPLEHFEKAYEMIKDENVNELTWKVLFAISELYIERGNLNKAKRYIVYARELIYFLSERIESHQLRAAYLQQNERLNALRKLENFYPSH